jgi:hypothetical protein
MSRPRCPLLGGIEYDSGVLIGSCPNFGVCLRLSYRFGDARLRRKDNEVKAH